MKNQMRIAKLEEKLKNAGLDGIFVLKESNIRYLTGFTSSDAYSIIAQEKRAFITDSRYTEQANREVFNYEIIKWRAPHAGLPETIKTTCQRYGIKKLGIEKKTMTVDMYETLSSTLDGIELHSADGFIEELRRIKDLEEIACIRKAAEIADKAFSEILKYVKIGVTEKDIERELQYLTKKLGADDIGFPLIIASGINSSMPHAVPSDKKIEEGDFITFDMGGLYHGYRSDMTRTVVVGKATDRQKEVYGLVLQSQESATKTIKAGLDGKIPHTKAREILEKSGVDGVFEYGVGHGVGLDIHEDPFMSARCELFLETGNIITVEPGVYIPGWGGIRIEDTVLVTESGYEVLTLAPKDLIELV